MAVTWGVPLPPVLLPPVLLVPVLPFPLLLPLQPARIATKAAQHQATLSLGIGLSGGDAEVNYNRMRAATLFRDDSKAAAQSRTQRKYASPTPISIANAANTQPHLKSAIPEMVRGAIPNAEATAF